VTEIPFYLVAAFSDQPFAGNPAAVCLLKKWLPDELLLKMAAAQPVGNRVCGT
jgi:predicted PhzF superfamily epimerase YddE/YHI9